MDEVIDLKPGRLLQGCDCRICGETVSTTCRICNGIGHFTQAERDLGLLPCDVCGLPVDPVSDACHHCG